MLRRTLTAVLVLSLCLPAMSLAVLYTCTMDGLTRMSLCEEHAATAPRIAGAGEGHGCAQTGVVPETCCEKRVVTASLESTSSIELSAPSGPVVSVASADASPRPSRSLARRAERPPGLGPPLYERFASYLI